MPVSIALIQKEYRAGRITDRIDLSLAFTNNLEKPLRALTGVVVFQDLFERDIMRVRVTIEEAIGVGETVTWEGGIDYNQFMDDHQRLRSIASGDLITKLETEAVIFQDGTRRSFGESSATDAWPVAVTRTVTNRADSG